MTFASEVTKDYAYKYLVGVRYGRAHREGDIHIHDLDYYPTKTTTCVQYDLEDIFNRGFHTKKRHRAHPPVDTELRHLGHHRFPDQPERAARRAGRFPLSTILWRRGC